MGSVLDAHDVEVDPRAKAKIAARLLRARRRRREVTATFREWLPAASPKFSWTPPHLQYLAVHLERVASGEIKRLIINAPPRHGKTELATIRFPVHLLERNPACKFLIGSYSDTQAAKFGRAARNLARRRIPSLDPERQSANEWQTLEGGVYRAVGRGNPPTGDGFDGLIVDDAFKSRMEANSRATREQAWTWFESDLMSRLEPGGWIIVNTTRWDVDDIPGRIMQGENAAAWTVINLPAIAEPGDLLGREPGEALWPERWSIEELESRWRDMTPTTRETVYQGHPRTPEGDALPVQSIKRRTYAETPLWKPGDPLLRCDKCGARSYRSLVSISESGEMPHECGGKFLEMPRFNRCRAWDWAKTIRHNADYTVGVLLEGPDPDGFMYWLDTVRGRWESAERNAIMRETAERDGRETRIRIPRDFKGPFGKEIVTIATTLLTGFTVIGLEPKGSKELRAEPLATTMGNGQLVLVTDAAWSKFYDRPPGTKDANDPERGRIRSGHAAQAIALDELRSFPGGKNDDIVDALADAHNQNSQIVDLGVH